MLVEKEKSIQSQNKMDSLNIKFDWFKSPHALEQKPGTVIAELQQFSSCYVRKKGG
jgi:hypothetical protein